MPTIFQHIGLSFGSVYRCGIWLETVRGFRHMNAALVSLSGNINFTDDLEFENMNKHSDWKGEEFRKKKKAEVKTIFLFIPEKEIFMYL